MSVHVIFCPAGIMWRVIVIVQILILGIQICMLALTENLAVIRGVQDAKVLIFVMIVQTIMRKQEKTQDATLRTDFMEISLQETMICACHVTKIDQYAQIIITAQSVNFKNFT